MTGGAVGGGEVTMVSGRTAGGGATGGLVAVVSVTARGGGCVRGAVIGRFTAADGAVADAETGSVADVVSPRATRAAVASA